MTTYPVSAKDIPASHYAGTEDVYYLFSVFQDPTSGDRYLARDRRYALCG